MTDPASPPPPNAPAPQQRRPVRPKYQVFISSTFLDLQGARSKVTWELLKAGHIPVGMENFSAADERGWRTIQRTIDTSDYYVLLIGGRYGSLDESIGMSWTEREYRYAKDKGVPVLAFIRDAAHVTADKIDRGKAAELLEAFLKTIKASHLCEPWTTEEDLCSRVSQAVRKQIDEAEMDGTPRPGWYRGDQLPSPATLNELAALSIENRNLRAQIEALDRPTHVVLEVLDANGQVASNVDLTQPYYVVLESREDEGIMVRRLGASKGPDRVKAAEEVNRTYWLRLHVRNAGNKVARNVLVDIDIDGVEDVGLNRETMLSATNGTEPEWATSAIEHVYVDYRRRRQGGMLVRQRIKQIAVNSSESLIGMGLRGRRSFDSAGGLRFAVRYRAVSEDGEAAEGAFTITIACVETIVAAEEFDAILT